MSARIPKATVCLWYDHNAEDAAKFYAQTVLGVPCIGLNGGQESQYGRCKDKWGLSWQITPKALIEAMAKGGETAKRAFAAMMTMKKIDVAAIKAAVHADA